MDDIKVRLPAGAEITLDLATWEWSGDDPLAVAAANLFSLDYEYVTADGQPGCRLAGIVAGKLGGEAILPPAPPVKEGVVY